MKLKEAVNYWVKSAQEDLKTAESLFKAKRYVHCLFFCHLFIEKLLKALIVKNAKDNPLPVHNLRRLAKDSGVKFTQEQTSLLEEINEFNIRARYNDIKFQFYKKATPMFTKTYFQKSKDLYLWLENQL